MKITRANLGLILCLSGLISLSADLARSEGLGTVAEDKREAEIEQWKRREIHIYGAVVDQNDEPVGGAEVLLHWQEFSTPFPGPMSKRWITTDEHGKWEFRQRAMRATVREARRDGYVFSMKQQDFGGITSDDLKNNRTSPTRRIVVRLHKTGESVFLMTDAAELARSSAGHPAAKRFDLFRRKTLPIAEATNQPQSAFYADLEIRLENIGTTGAWRVTYRTSENGDGLIATNALLFEAPASGYVSEYVLDGVHDQDFPRYLYLRTRAPSVYTRFDMSYSLRPDSCVVSYESASNPYGDRSLEPNAELEPLWQLREQLTKEARAEIMAGNRPNKADLPKVIRAAKEKTAEGGP